MSFLVGSGRRKPPIAPTSAATRRPATDPVEPAADDGDKRLGPLYPASFRVLRSSGPGRPSSSTSSSRFAGGREDAQPNEHASEDSLRPDQRAIKIVDESARACRLANR